MLKSELPRYSVCLLLGFYCSVFPKVGSQFDPRWATGSKQGNISEVGTADPGMFLVGALLMDDGMFMEEDGKIPISDPCQTRASCTLNL